MLTIFFTKNLLNNSAVEMDPSVSVTSETDVDFFFVQKSLDNTKQCTLVVLIVMHKFGVIMFV